jgi:hypothetical protein
LIKNFASRHFIDPHQNDSDGAVGVGNIMKKGMPLQATEGPGQWPRAPVAETIVNP